MNHFSDKNLESLKSFDYYFDFILISILRLNKYLTFNLLRIAQ